LPSSLGDIKDRGWRGWWRSNGEVIEKIERGCDKEVEVSVEVRGEVMEKIGR
jgi:hypothetical protein